MAEAQHSIADARVLVRAGEFASAESALRSLVEGGDTSAAVALLLARVLVRQDKHEEALAAARAARDGNLRNANHWVQLAYVFQALNDHEGEAGAWRAVLEFEPDFVPALTRLARYGRALGRSEEAAAYEVTLKRAREKELPKRLADELQALNTARTPAAVMNERIRWGWELADKTVWTFDRWWERVVWGQRATTLIGNWWMASQDRMDELDALIDGPDARVFAGTEHKGCLIAGTHLGAIYAGVHYLAREHPFKTFNGDAPGLRHAYIARTTDTFASYRKLLRELKSGTWIGFGGDSAGAGERVTASLAGRTISLSTVFPRLMTIAKTPCLWWQPLWRDGRVVIEAERLPDPERGEAEAEWHRRWIAAYVVLLERLMRGSPENLLFGAGIWAHADRLGKEADRPHDAAIVAQEPG